MSPEEEGSIYSFVELFDMKDVVKVLCFIFISILQIVSLVAELFAEFSDLSAAA